jgi:hypothetical protein
LPSTWSLPPYGVPSIRLNLGKEWQSGRGRQIVAAHLMQLNTGASRSEKLRS